MQRKNEWLLAIGFAMTMLIFSSTEAKSEKNTACLSKLEQRLFWKASNYTPSMYLRRSIRKYELFHKRCRNESASLSSEELFSVLKGDLDKKLTCKYLIWYPPYDGLGNKLVSLVSAYLYALLSKRVLIIDRRLNLDSLLCDPFENSSWLLPPGLRTDLLQKSATPFNSWVDSNEVEKTPHSILVNVNHEPNVKFFCSHELANLRKVKVLHLESNMYFVPGFYYTSYKRKMENMFPDRLIFTPLGRRILNPSNSIWERITGFYHKKLKPAKEKVGLQLRTREAPWRIEKSERLEKCIQEKKVLPHDKLFLNKSQEEAGKRKEVHVAAFVATLKSEFVSELRKRYSGRQLRNGGVVKFYRASQQTAQNSSNSNQNVEAMVDMWLLSFTDNLLISHTSTFGYIASALQGKPPLMINHAHLTREEDLRTDVSLCDSAVTPEPCYHNPPFQVQCPNDPPFKDPWNQDEAVRRCVDWIRGVQVVPK